MDQTGIVYLPGYKTSYEKKGSKQIDIIGKDEKRAFTLCVSSTADGQFLPFQLIFGGKTARSCPTAKADKMERALSSGLRFTCAASEKNPSSHYSTLKTMKEVRIFIHSSLILLIISYLIYLVHGRNLPPSLQTGLVQ